MADPLGTSSEFEPVACNPLEYLNRRKFLDTVLEEDSGVEIDAAVVLVLMGLVGPHDRDLAGDGPT